MAFVEWVRTTLVTRTWSGASFTRDGAISLSKLATDAVAEHIGDTNGLRILWCDETRRIALLPDSNGLYRWRREMRGKPANMSLSVACRDFVSHHKWPLGKAGGLHVPVVWDTEMRAVVVGPMPAPAIPERVIAAAQRAVGLTACQQAQVFYIVEPDPMSPSSGLAHCLILKNGVSAVATVRRTGDFWRVSMAGYPDARLPDTRTKVT